MAEYTPSEDDVERFYVDARYRRTHDDYAVTRAEFDRFLARVRRDAWNEGASHAEAKEWITAFRADDLRADNPYETEAKP